MVLSFNEFSAWITIEGRTVDEYKAEGSSKGASCWIPSEAGRQYQVCWRDSKKSTATDGLVVIDGQRRGSKTISNEKDKPDTACKRGFRSTSSTLFPFQFSAIVTTDDADRADPSNANVGVIELLIFRVKIKGAEIQIHRGTPKDRTYYERETKGLQHHTTLGNPQEGNERAAVGLRLLSEDPVACFRFRYRSIGDMLRTGGIAPPLGIRASDPIVILDDDPEEADINIPLSIKETRKFVMETVQKPVSSKDFIVISDDESEKDGKPLPSEVQTTTTVSDRRKRPVHTSPWQDLIPAQPASTAASTRKSRSTPSLKQTNPSTINQELGDLVYPSQSVKVSVEEKLRPSKASSTLSLKPPSTSSETVDGVKRRGSGETMKPSPPLNYGTKHLRDPRRTPVSSKRPHKSDVSTSNPRPTVKRDDPVYLREEVHTTQLKSEETTLGSPSFKEESPPPSARRTPHTQRKSTSEQIVGLPKAEPESASLHSLQTSNKVKFEEPPETKRVPSKRRVEEEIFSPDSDDDISPSERAMVEAKMNALWIPEPWNVLGTKTKIQKRPKPDSPE